MARFERNPGSFRDPSGYVFSDGQRILRGLGQKGKLEFDAALRSGLIDTAIERGLLITSRLLNEPSGDLGLMGPRGEPLSEVIEHPKIPLILYPYEWTFGQLKDAALQHLDLQLLALKHGFELSDASAYNMQFDRGLPLHIDVLSIRRYKEGRPWEGYNQFCRQFLLPLLLEACLDVPFQRWYRGSPRGLDLEEFKRLVPAWKRFTHLNLFMHVQLQSSAVSRASSNVLSGEAVRIPNIPKQRYQAMLEGLSDWISKLGSGRRDKTYWADYSSVNSYSGPEKDEKLAFVEHTIRRWEAHAILDAGGNSGDYSEAALAGGASHVYCLDGDVDALEIAYEKRKSTMPGLLPVVMDWSDPSPGQGWAGRERQPMDERMRADAVMALAIVHHIVIGDNIPLGDFVRRLFSFADRVIVEFVPKEDPMVQGLLRSRSDIFPDYSAEHFVSLLEAVAVIEEAHAIRTGGRILFACRKR